MQVGSVSQGIAGNNRELIRAEIMQSREAAQAVVKGWGRWVERQPNEHRVVRRKIMKVLGRAFELWIALDYVQHESERCSSCAKWVTWFERANKTHRCRLDSPPHGGKLDVEVKGTFRDAGPPPANGATT